MISGRRYDVSPRLYLYITFFLSILSKIEGISTTTTIQSQDSVSVRHRLKRIRKKKRNFKFGFDCRFYLKPCGVTAPYWFVHIFFLYYCDVTDPVSTGVSTREMNLGSIDMSITVR